MNVSNDGKNVSGVQKKIKCNTAQDAGTLDALPQFPNTHTFISTKSSHDLKSKFSKSHNQAGILHFLSVE